MNNKKKIIIEEQDIFNYVFFPHNLSPEKIYEIEANQTFREAVEFYNQLKANSEKSPNEKIRKIIAEKIPAYKLLEIIELFPQQEHLNSNQSRKNLAAAEKILTPKITTKTFVDNEKEYLIKVLNFSNETKIFVFSTKDEVVKNFDIFIQPQNLKYHFEDNSEPLIINALIEPEKIQLKLT